MISSAIYAFSISKFIIDEKISKKNKLTRQSLEIQKMMTIIETLPMNYTELLENHEQVTLFGIGACLRTRKAIGMLRKIKLDFQFVDVDALCMSDDDKQSLAIMSGFVEFPKIFIGRVCVGGLRELNSSKYKPQFAETLDSNNKHYDRDALIGNSECRIF